MKKLRFVNVLSTLLVTVLLFAGPTYAGGLDSALSSLFSSLQGHWEGHTTTPGAAAGTLGASISIAFDEGGEDGVWTEQLETEAPNGWYSANTVNYTVDNDQLFVSDNGQQAPVEILSADRTSLRYRFSRRDPLTNWTYVTSRTLALKNELLQQSEQVTVWTPSGPSNQGRPVSAEALQASRF